MTLVGLDLSVLDDPTPKGFRDGTDRLISPAETVARVRRFMPVMGITRIANVTGLDHIGIPVVMVCRPNARALSVAQGKGIDLACAEASGLMESIEAYHAEHISLPLKLASYEDLRYTHRVVDVQQLPRKRNAQFHPYLPIHWIEGYDLLQREQIWLPYELVHTNYTMAMHHTMAGFVATSNGLASGNHPIEAISHAICEVVERDSTTLWHLLDATGRARTRIDLDTVDDRACHEVLEKYRRAHVAVVVWETTSDIGIPAFLCRIVDLHDNAMRRLGTVEGMGCHPVRAIALLRALTEAAQGRLTLIAGSRDDCYPTHYLRQRDPAAANQLRADVTNPAPRRHFANGPNWQAAALRDDLVWELERLRAARVERVIMIDLSKPEFGVSVVRIVIPGLEAFNEHRQNLPGRRAQAHTRSPV